MKIIDKPADLHGLWPAVPTPWTREGALALDTLARNVERLGAIPMDGVYTTDSDGEFYAIELEDFRRLARAFARAVEPTGMGAAMGVTWTSTRGIIDRMRAGLEAGIRAFHVAYPFWMPLSAGDVERFWEDLARAVPESRWIHYNTSRAHVVARGTDYARWTAAWPDQFIGTKLMAVSMPDILEYADAAPGLAHFVTDYSVCPCMLMGAAGNYSYWANTLPRWTRRLVDAARAGEWAAAAAMQKRLLIWEQRHTALVRRPGHLHGIVGKARGGLSGFLEDTGYTQPPYYPVPAELQAQYQRAFAEYWDGES